MSDLIHSIYAVFTAAQAKDKHLPQPVDVQETASTIVLTFVGEIEGIGSVSAGLLRDAEINYDDPRPGTDDINVAISTGGRQQPRCVVTLNRLTKEEYEAILDGATDPDGDGVLELTEPVGS